MVQSRRSQITDYAGSASNSKSLGVVGRVRNNVQYPPSKIKVERGVYLGCHKVNLFEVISKSFHGRADENNIIR